jgi:hypothetical protein
VLLKALPPTPPRRLGPAEALFAVAVVEDDVVDEADDEVTDADAEE